MLGSASVTKVDCGTQEKVVVIADELVTIVRADEPLDAPGLMTNDRGGIVVFDTTGGPATAASVGIVPSGMPVESGDQKQNPSITLPF